MTTLISAEQFRKELRAKHRPADAMGNHTKALNLLDGVVRALDADPDADPAGKPDPEKAAQLVRAAALKAKHKV